MGLPPASTGYGGLVTLICLAVAGVLIALAIIKSYEPYLLVPIGFGAILANLPLAEMGADDEGIIALIYDSGIRTELLPPLIFLGVGVLTDFRPLLGRPLTFLLGIDTSNETHQIDFIELDGVAQVPAPATLAVFSLGLLALGFAARARR